MEKSVLLWLAAGAVPHYLPGAGAVNAADTYTANQRELQQTVDAAPSHTVVQCDPNRLLILAGSVTIRKPLTLVGLWARLPEKPGNTSLIVVTNTPP